MDSMQFNQSSIQKAYNNKHKTYKILKYIIKHKLEMCVKYINL